MVSRVESQADVGITGWLAVDPGNGQRKLSGLYFPMVALIEGLIRYSAMGKRRYIHNG